MDLLSHEPFVARDPRPSASARQSRVLMIGPDLNVRGGVSAVERLLLGNLPAQVTATHIASMLEGSKFLKLRVFLRAWLQARQALKSPIDIVHIHFASRASFVRKQQFARLALSKGKRLIMHAHGGGFRDYWNSMGSRQRRNTAQVLSRANALIVLGDGWRDFYASIGVSPERIVVLPNPVVLPKAVPYRTVRETVQFVYLGLISRDKGAFDIVQAVARLPEEWRGRVRVVIAGNGENQQLRSEIAIANLSQQIEVRDWIDAVQRDALLKQADAFILPSYHEGLPMALLEAMAWGLPPICTPVGSIPEVVRNRLNGLLVTPGDIPQLAASIQRLAANPTERMRMGALARAMVEPMSITAYMEQLRALYEAVIQTGLPPRS